MRSRTLVHDDESGFSKHTRRDIEFSPRRRTRLRKRKPLGGGINTGEMRHVEQATTVSRQSTLTSAATIVAALPWADRTATITASVTNQKGCISRLSSYGHGTEVVALADCGVHHSFLRMSKVARCSYRDTCGEHCRSTSACSTDRPQTHLLNIDDILWIQFTLKTSGIEEPRSCPWSAPK